MPSSHFALSGNSRSLARRRPRAVFRLLGDGRRKRQSRRLQDNMRAKQYQPLSWVWPQSRADSRRTRRRQKGNSRLTQRPVHCGLQIADCGIRNPRHPVILSEQIRRVTSERPRTFALLASWREKMEKPRETRGRKNAKTRPLQIAECEIQNGRAGIRNPKSQAPCYGLRANTSPNVTPQSRADTELRDRKEEGENNAESQSRREENEWDCVLACRGMGYCLQVFIPRSAGPPPRCHEGASSDLSVAPSFCLQSRQRRALPKQKKRQPLHRRGARKSPTEI